MYFNTAYLKTYVVENIKKEYTYIKINYKILKNIKNKQ